MKAFGLKILFIIIISLLTVGCSSTIDTPTPIPPTTPPEPTATAEPTPSPEPEGIVVTFDGRGCTVTGPTELPVGDQPFILIDNSDQEVDLWVSRLLDGKTLGDLIADQSAPGVWWPAPEWVEYSRLTSGPLRNRQGEGEIWNYLVDVEGDYFIYVGHHTPEKKSLWFCAPLTVVAAANQ